jgi:hypothetical protein
LTALTTAHAADRAGRPGVGPRKTAGGQPLPGAIGYALDPIEWFPTSGYGGFFPGLAWRTKTVQLP